MKHFVCDGPLQTKTMVDQKSIYGAWQGILHSGLHGIGTGVVFIGAGQSISWVFGMALLDFVIHYHVDFSKENIVKYFRWGTSDAKFWWALSADQMIHQLTYLLLAALVLRA
ncbi:MAG: DUF3307 domain-containing protein [Alphaproteobacteria bacterium]|nr:DUF3307 domain-containing protein [Alphaproteobacteria bacterium]